MRGRRTMAWSFGRTVDRFLKFPGAFYVQSGTRQPKEKLEDGVLVLWEKRTCEDFLYASCSSFCLYKKLGLFSHEFL